MPVEEAWLLDLCSDFPQCSKAKLLQVKLQNERKGRSETGALPILCCVLGAGPGTIPPAPADEKKPSTSDAGGFVSSPDYTKASAAR